MPDEHREVAVVGGGIAGLALGFHLARRGFDVRVIESGDRPGGNIRSEARDGYLCEWGPIGFLDNEPATLRLVTALGLDGELETAAAAGATRFVVRAGRLRRLPASPPGFLASDVLTLGGRLRVLGEWLVPAKRSPEDESVFDFAARRVGGEAAAVLIDAMVTGIHGGDPRRLSLASCFPRMRAMEAEHGGLFRALVAARRTRRAGGGSPGGPMGPGGRLTSFRGGLERLIGALAGALGPRLTLATPVAGLALDGRGFRVETARGTVTARRIVLATPAWSAAPLVRALDPELAADLDAIPSAPIAVVCLGYAETDLAAVPRGFGFLVPGAERLPILGTLFDSWTFAGRAPVGRAQWRVMVGGARDPEAVGETDAQLVARALTTFDRLLGLRATPEMTLVVRHPRGIPQYVIGHGKRIARIAARLARFPGLSLTGNSYRGIAMNACIHEAEAVAEQLAEGRGA